MVGIPCEGSSRLDEEVCFVNFLAGFPAKIDLHCSMKVVLTQSKSETVGLCLVFVENAAVLVCSVGDLLSESGPR